MALKFFKSILLIPSKPSFPIPTFTMSRPNSSTSFTRGHVEHIHTCTTPISKKIWRLVRRITPTTTSPTLCPLCIEDHLRETRMQNFISAHEMRTNPNPLRQKRVRCAPPARGINQTLVAITLAEDPSSIHALKAAQRHSHLQAKARTAEKVEKPTRLQQEAQRWQTRADFADAESFWLDIHESHRGKIHFDLARPYSSFAGPRECGLCRGHRDAIVDPSARAADHFVLDDFDPEVPDELVGGIKLEIWGEVDELEALVERRLTSRGSREQELEGCDDAQRVRLQINDVDLANVPLPLSPIEAESAISACPQPEAELEEEEQPSPVPQLPTLLLVPSHLPTSGNKHHLSSQQTSGPSHKKPRT